MGDFMKQNAGTIGSGIGTGVGSLVGQPQLGAMAGGLAGNAITGSGTENLAAQPGVNVHDQQRQAQMALLGALMQMLQGTQMESRTPTQPMSPIMPNGR